VVIIGLAKNVIIEYPRITRLSGAFMSLTLPIDRFSRATRA
jgi:hypothetical protein